MRAWALKIIQHICVCVCVMFVEYAMGCTVVLWNRHLGDLAMLDRAVIPGQPAPRRFPWGGDVVKKIRWLVLGLCHPGA